MTHGRTVVATLALALTFASCVGCADPVHDDAVSALGPEDPQVPRGPLHRAGQPCLTCHGGDGPSEHVFSFAGTVYRSPSGGGAVASSHVHIVDHGQLSYEVDTNCAGNFFVTTADFTPAFPAVVAVTSTEPVVMRTLMNRSGSCNECHTTPAGPASPGLVWVPPTSTPTCVPRRAMLESPDGEP